MISMPTGRRFPKTPLTITASRSSGRCSSATSARMRRINTPCWKAPRVSNWSNARCKAGKSGAGSTSLRSKVEGLTMNKPVLPISSLSLQLPKADRSIETYRLAASRTFPSKLEGTLNRIAFSAAHVVADPRADVDPWLTAAVDWDRTIAFREHIWDLGLGVAEAMDTAQRGMGLDWPTSLELIQRSVKASKARSNALVFSGAGTDHLAAEDAKTIDDVIRAYEEQIAAVEKAGGRIILMASRALARIGRNADDYAKVYDRVLSQVSQPVIIHWLGEVFDPALANYWGTKSLDPAMDIGVSIINTNAAKVDGVKVSLLDKRREIDMRRRLDPQVK